VRFSHEKRSPVDNRIMKTRFLYYLICALTAVTASTCITHDSVAVPKTSDNSIIPPELTLYEEAEGLFKDKDYEKALKQYKHITRDYFYSDDYSARAYRRIAEIYRAQHNYYAAHVAAARFLRYYPTHTDYEYMLYLDGVVCYQHGLYYHAESRLKKYVIQYPYTSKYVSAYYFIGASLLRQRKPAEAMEYFLYIVHEAPKTPYALFAHYYIAYCIHLTSGDIQLAYTQLQLLKNKRPDMYNKNFVQQLLKKIVWTYYYNVSDLGDHSVITIDSAGDESWLGYWQGGITRIRHSSGATKSYRAGKTKLNSNYVRDILIDTRFVWVATLNGLAAFDRHDNTWRVFNPPDKKAFDRIKAIIRQGKTLWLCSLGGGLGRYNTETGAWKRFYAGNTAGIPSNFIVCGAADHNSIWFGTLKSGMFRWSKQKKQFYAYHTRDKNRRIVENDIRQIAVDNSHVWIATYRNGISVYNKQKRKWYYLPVNGIMQSVPKKNSINHQYYIGDICVYADQKLLVGTIGDGLFLYDYIHETWTHLTKHHGLPSDNIASIAADGDYIWVGTFNKGAGVMYYPLDD